MAETVDRPLAALAASHSIIMADLAVWLEMQDARITALEREMAEVHNLVADAKAALKRDLDPHQRKAERNRAMGGRD